MEEYNSDISDVDTIDSLKSFEDTSKFIKIVMKNYDYKVKTYKFIESKLNSTYGIPMVTEIELNGTHNPLIIIPGYSFSSFTKMFNKIITTLDILNDKYSALYIVTFSDTIKKISEELIKDVTDKDKQYIINEKYRIELADMLSKIIKNIANAKGFTTYDLMGKSAGGGVASYIASNNIDNVNALYLISPGSNSRGLNLLDFKNPIKLSWNKDDNIISFDEIILWITNLKNKNGTFMYYSYETGGHELNHMFIKEL
jgi:hypothetical protein